MEVARAHGVSMPIDELGVLLPPGARTDEPHLREWLQAHPTLARLERRRAVPEGLAPVLDEEQARIDRGVRYWEHAQWAVGSVLRPMLGLTRCVGVTGSVAYGEPAPGDDLDFMVVTRSGALWPFLLATFLRSRGAHRRSRGDGPEWCFNYVLDDREALRDFAKPRGFLFAREALMTRMVSGEEYYRGLLGGASWLREELPRLHARWQLGGLGDQPDPRPASLAVRLAGAALFPLLATYLQLRGLVANRRFRRSGRGDRVFRTVTTWRRYALETEHFDWIGGVMADGSAIPAARGG